MATTPFSPNEDRTDAHVKSGAERLIILGRSMTALLESVRGYVPNRNGKQAQDLRSEVKKELGETVRFFETSKRAAMRKHVLSESGKRIDPRACLTIGYTAACALDHNDPVVPIMRLAQAVSLCGPPSEVLEARRFLASWGSLGKLMPGKGVAPHTPFVGLSRQFLTVIFKRMSDCLA